MFKDKRFIMKTKFLLSVATLALFAACSDDSNSSAPENNVPGTDTPAVEDPSGNTTTDPAADPTKTDPASTDPAADPATTDPATDPATDPVTDPTTDPVETPDSVPAPEPYRLEVENMIPDNQVVEVDDFDNYEYWGAELSGREQFTYGRFEARMKMVSIPGSVSSMFLYYDPSYMLGEEPWNEIDIEVLGTNPGVWQSNLITRLPDEGKKNPKITSEYKTGFGFNSTEDFHLFAFVWTPEYISWEIDSVEVRRDVLGMAKGQVEFMTKEQTLRFNLWASKSAGWTGKYTGAELADGPVAQWIDYVRVYTYDPETKTFAEHWTDDFDGEALDRTRWSRGNWEMENVTLSVDHVVVEDGYCKLLMTRTPKMDPAPAE